MTIYEPTGGIYSAGPVGIGTQDPKEKLDVVGNINLNSYQIIGMRVQNSGSAPVACNFSNAGYIYFDTTEKLFKGCNGSIWIQLGYQCAKLNANWRKLNKPGFIALQKDDNTFFNRDSCANDWIPIDYETNGIPFKGGPALVNGREASLDTDGNWKTIDMNEQNLQVKAVYIIAPGGRCGSRTYRIKWNYSDGSSLEASRVLPWDCQTMEHTCDSTSCVWPLGKAGGNCCDYNFMIKWINTKSSTGINSVSLHNDCGCACDGSWENTQEVWTLTVEVGDPKYQIICP